MTANNSTTNNVMFFFVLDLKIVYFAQSAGAAEYTDYISAEG